MLDSFNDLEQSCTFNSQATIKLDEYKNNATHFHTTQHRVYNYFNQLRPPRTQDIIERAQAIKHDADPQDILVDLLQELSRMGQEQDDSKELFFHFIDTQMLYLEQQQGITNQIKNNYDLLKLKNKTIQGQLEHLSEMNSVLNQEQQRHLLHIDSLETALGQAQHQLKMEEHNREATHKTTSYIQEVKHFEIKQIQRQFSQTMSPPSPPKAQQCLDCLQMQKDKNRWQKYITTLEQKLHEQEATIQKQEQTITAFQLKKAESYNNLMRFQNRLDTILTDGHPKTPSSRKILFNEASSIPRKNEVPSEYSQEGMHEPINNLKSANTLLNRSMDSIIDSTPAQPRKRSNSQGSSVNHSALGRLKLIFQNMQSNVSQVSHNHIDLLSYSRAPDESKVHSPNLQLVSHPPPKTPAFGHYGYFQNQHKIQRPPEPPAPTLSSLDQLKVMLLFLYQVLLNRTFKAMSSPSGISQTK